MTFFSLISSILYRFVVLSVPPFLVVHANAAFYRLTGFVSSSFIINQPLASLFHFPKANKDPTTIMGDKTLSWQDNDGDKEDFNNPWDSGNSAIQSMLTTCGHGDVLPMHIVAASRVIHTQGVLASKRTPTPPTATLHCADCNKHSEEDDEEDSNDGQAIQHQHPSPDPKVMDFRSCFISIRPVIRETGSFSSKGNTTRLLDLSSLMCNQQHATKFSSSFRHASCNTDGTGQNISHYVIHLKMKDETVPHKTAHQELATADAKMKSDDTETCSSSGTKPILACA